MPVALLLGDAGPDWRSTGAWTGTVVMLPTVNVLATGLGGGVGVRQAAAGGAQSHREALLAGCGLLVLAAAGLTLGSMEFSLGGVVASWRRSAASSRARWGRNWAASWWLAGSTGEGGAHGRRGPAHAARGPADP